MVRRGVGLVAGTALLLALSVLGAADKSDTAGQSDTAAASGNRAGPERLPTPPPRIVSTNLQTDEILLALEPQTKIVAVSTFAADPAVSNVVDRAAQVPHHITGKAERILALRPGVVFASPYGQKRTEMLLREANVPVVHVPGANSIDGIERNIRKIGDVVGRPERAETLIRQMRRRLARVREQVEDAPAPRVLLWNTGGYTSGKGSLFDELLRAAGGRNVAAEAGLKHTARLPVARALALDPDVIFVVDYRADAKAREVMPEPALLDNPLWQTVTAVRKGQVHAVPKRHILSSSHHAAKAAEDMARRLHPDRFARSRADETSARRNP